MKKLFCILLSLAMFCTLTAAVYAKTVTEIPFTIHSTALEGNVLTAVDNVIAASDITGKGVTLISNAAVYNAKASIHNGFIIKVTDIAWDAANKNGIMIYVSSAENGTVVHTAPDSLALYVNKSGDAYMWTNVKNGFNENAHPFGKWTDLFAEKKDALADSVSSFYYAILPLDPPGCSQYGVFVTANAPATGSDTPIYTYNTTWTDATGGGGFDGTADTLFNAMGKDAKTFNFCFQIWADGALSWSDGITTIPSAGSLSYKVASIELPSVSDSGNDPSASTGDAVTAVAFAAAAAGIAIVCVKKRFAK